MNKFDEYFKNEYEDGYSAVFVSKFTTEVEVDEKLVPLYTVVEVGDWNGGAFVDVSLIPEPKYLSRELQESLIEENDLQRIDDVMMYDITSRGGAPRIMNFVFEGEDLSDEEKQKFYAKSYEEIVNKIEAVGLLVGFYLDKPQNMIGENGWDWLGKML